MQEQIVSFEVAKLAKEIGFNIDTFNFYDSDRTHLEFKLKEKTIYTNIGYYYHRDCFMAPTQSLLQQYLREKHNLYVVVELDCTTTPKFGYKLRQFIGDPLDLSKDWSWNIIETEFSLFRTYEEALEDGLKQALNYLKNEK